jgi:peroxiredoxin
MEAPELRAVARDESRRGVDLVGVDVRDSSTAARAFVDDFDLPYPMLPDGDRRLQLALAPFVPASSIPSTVVIDRRGRVAATVIGAVDGAALRGLLARLLDE